MVELLGGDHLLELEAFAYTEALERFPNFQQFVLGGSLLLGVAPERANVTGDVYLALVHRVPDRVSDIATDDNAALLHHIAG